MNDYVEKINASGISIYDVRPLTNPNLYIPTETLQEILNSGLVGFSVKGMPLRTRSKAVKSEICRLLGYPVPSTFKRTRPRFFGQNFEAFVQSALNVQIWNEEVDLDRRYVFVKVSGDDLVTKVKVISGAELIGYDKTGTLTHKYQALMPEDGPDAYASEKDTSAISELTRSALENIDLSQTSPCLPPRHGELLPIRTIYEKLLPTIGLTVKQLMLLPAF